MRGSIALAKAAGAARMRGGRAVLVAMQGASGFDNCQMAVYGMPHGSDAPESGKGF